LFSWLWAKRNKGEFVLRIEDTDKKREVENGVEMIKKTLKDFGLVPDEGPGFGGERGPYLQSERLDFYEKYAKKLVEQKDAYYCFCTSKRLEEMRKSQQEKKQIPRYDRKCLGLSEKEVKERLEKGEEAVIRLKMPQGEVLAWQDLVMGEVKINSREVDDTVLLKSDGFPTYHLAVVVDDHLMEISHIFRDVRWMSSTPKHIVLYRALGWQMPELGHLPLVLGADKKPLSKRHGSVSADDFLKEGYLPEAILNYLALVGWNPKTEEELFLTADLVKKFNIEGIHKAGGVFDYKKLVHTNAWHISRKTDEELADIFEKWVPKLDEKTSLILAPLLKTRIKKLSELPDLLRFLWEEVDYERQLLVQKTGGELAKKMLEGAKKVMKETKEFVAERLQTKLMSLIEKENWKIGEFFMVLRVAICGSAITPPVVECLPILGKEEVLKRLDKALGKI
jgi:glutamyl-tRNA synthetase